MSVRIWLNVKPAAKREAIEVISEGEYNVWVRAAARDGRANEAVIDLLAKHFRLRKSALRIVRGEKTRRKLVQIG
jgi:uncharacterized protein (TIGR00251 family)